jgi:CubicO group peptidase (beta-lactamase class C family)
LPSRNRITVRGHEDEDVTGIHGEVAPGFEAVRDAFARLFADGAERGAAAAAIVDGRRVADLWGGTVRRDALVHVYSVSKPFAAACALWLVDRGMLELDTRVVELWPEYGQGGSIGWADPPARWRGRTRPRESATTSARSPARQRCWPRSTARLASGTGSVAAR